MRPLFLKDTVCVCLVALVKKAIFHYLPFKLRSVKQKPNASMHASFIPHAFFVRTMKKSSLKMTHHRFFFPSFQPFFITDLVFADAVVCSLHAPIPPSNTPKNAVNATAIVVTLASAEQALIHPKLFFLHPDFHPMCPYGLYVLTVKRNFKNVTNLCHWLSSHWRKA